MRRAAKIDRNQPAIVEALRREPGVSVLSLAAVGKGCPDLIVGVGGRNLLFEVKSEGGTLTPDQEEFARKWNGQYEIIRSPEDALFHVRIAARKKSLTPESR